MKYSKKKIPLQSGRKKEHCVNDSFANLWCQSISSCGEQKVNTTKSRAPKTKSVLAPCETAAFLVSKQHLAF